ncbi:hypothetical protein [Yinghuangia soli]|uniref:Uncharacterized protein n=1 Tax=Yinghuangia soli TaxID=2908204 RepID=A0AA41PTM1_9ACTN|nr:hypothetical protein [Yinghuangia soli]MCF2525655.1 hypothetical protein [Yinghuangia soli]
MLRPDRGGWGVLAVVLAAAFVAAFLYWDDDARRPPRSGLPDRKSLPDAMKTPLPLPASALLTVEDLPAQPGAPEGWREDPEYRGTGCVQLPFTASDRLLIRERSFANGTGGLRHVVIRHPLFEGVKDTGEQLVDAIRACAEASRGVQVLEPAAAATLLWSIDEPGGPRAKPTTRMQVGLRFEAGTLILVVVDRDGPQLAPDPALMDTLLDRAAHRAGFPTRPAYPTGPDETEDGGDEEDDGGDGGGQPVPVAAR